MEPTKARIDPKLDAFYRATTFEAALPDGELGIRIGQSHPRLDALLKEQGAGTWAYITACNPGSADLPPEENDKRHTDLLRYLEVKGFRIFLGEGRPDEPGWNPETSVLVIGIEHEAAMRLGQGLGQNAIVIGRHEGVAELVWLPPPSEQEEEDRPPRTESGYAYVGSKTAHRFLKKCGIDGLKDLKVYVDSVHLHSVEPERLAYVCWGRAGTGEFSTQTLYVNVKRDSRGRAVAETFCVVFEPSEYPDPSLAPACDLETALYVVTGGDSVTLTADRISDEAIKEIRKDLRKL